MIGTRLMLSSNGHSVRNSDVNDNAKKSAKSCPICGKPSDEKFRPFCSRRCADVDLNRWLSGAYAIPVKEVEDEDGERETPKPPDDAA